MEKRAADPHQPQTEFIFGSLSTAGGRIQRARSLNAGLQLAPHLAPIDPRPGEAVTISVRAGVGVALEAATLYYTLDGSLPAVAAPETQHLAMRRTGSDWDTLTWSYGEMWCATLPGQPENTCVRYLIIAQTTNGKTVSCPYIDLSAPELVTQPDNFDQRYFHRLLRQPAPQVFEFNVDRLEIPAWLREAVIYQIFIDRFAPIPGQPFADTQDLGAFFGGVLRGITARLNYLSELGVNCLWLTPIFPAPSHHGYDPTDYFAVEPRLGDMADFQELVAAAHGRGLRVVLDFVANHLSRQHPAFVAAQADPASPTCAWFFFRDYPQTYEAFYDVPDQPVVNTDLPAVREYLIGAAQYWLQSGCDGFRLDHAHGATQGFWSAFRAAIRAVKSDAAIFGEITDTPALMRSYTGRMDGVLDFQLLELLRGFFVFRSISASQLDRALQQHFAYFRSELVLPSFLDNHDMNRFLWSVEGDARRLKLAALCQFTLPQPPILYYGTEVGLSQRRAVGRLEEARLPMLWNEQQDRALLDFYRRLIQLRRQTTNVWSEPRTTVWVDDEHGLYAYRCGAYLVVLNNHDQATALACPAAELILSTDTGVTLVGEQLGLPPFAGAICRFY